MAPLWAEDDHAPAARAAANVWRMARPDLFSVRNTSVPAYLQPMVHEVKASRADLLSDLRHDAKRQAYQWLCEECYYVFPAGIAEPEEIPEHFGIWVLHGSVDDGRFELLRPARHNRCTLPFSVWMALCKATPLRSDDDMAQTHLGEPAPRLPPTPLPPRHDLYRGGARAVRVHRQAGRPGPALHACAHRAGRYGRPCSGGSRAGVQAIAPRWH